MELNTQAPERPFSHPDGSVEVHSIWRTIQGEGPYAGQPATFVRLAGCNLRCPLCDTDYTSSRELMHPDTITREIKRLWTGHPDPPRLIVLTGGEPFRQDIYKLVSTFYQEAWTTQIETNGTAYCDLPWWVREHGYLTVVCSPKAARIDERLLKYIDAYKYVIQADYVGELDGLPTRVLDRRVNPARPRKGMFRELIYVQPCDEKDEVANRRNLEAAVKSCMEFGYRLCLQVHKIAGLE